MAALMSAQGVDMLRPHRVDRLEALFLLVGFVMIGAMIGVGL